MRALVVQIHAQDHAGLIGEALEARGYTLDTWFWPERYRDASLDGVDVVVLLGSTSGVYDVIDDGDWFDAEVALVREADRRGIGVLGICFGAQTLCHVFGGRVVPGAVPEIGWRRVLPRPGSPLGAGPWFEYHFDYCEVPDDVEVWAESEYCVQAFARGAHVGVQFHPEIDGAQLADWITAGDGDLRDLGVNETDLLEETRREEPDARRRADELVALFLARGA